MITKLLTRFSDQCSHERGRQMINYLINKLTSSLYSISATLARNILTLRLTKKQRSLKLKDHNETVKNNGVLLVLHPSWIFEYES